MMGEVVDVLAGTLVESTNSKPVESVRFKRAEAYTRCYVDAELGRCERCNGQLVQDTVREDGSWDVRCWTCRMIKASG